MTTNNKKNYENWVNCKWRPFAAWTYIAICAFDFIISPIVFSWFQYSINQPIAQWVPLTLQGSGIVHISYGAIIGIAAWGRTIEKMKVNMGGKRDYYDDDRDDRDYRRYDGKYNYQQPYEDR